MQCPFIRICGFQNCRVKYEVSLHASVPIIRMSWHFLGYIKLRGREHLMLRNTSSRHTITEIVGGAGAFGFMFWVRDGDDE